MCSHVLLNIDPYILLKSKTAMPTEVLWQLQTPDTRLQRVTPLTSAVCPPPLMDGAAAGTWRGETDASGLHGVDVAVVFARMLLPGVPLGRPNTTGWRGPLVKACPWEVKGQDLVVNRSRVRWDGGPGR